MQPLSTSRNSYYKNEKNSTVYTPPVICNFLYNILNKFLLNRTAEGFKYVVDTSVGSGNLLNPFIEKTSNLKYVGYDVKDVPDRNKEIIFYKRNFLSLNNSLASLDPDFSIKLTADNVALVIQNPPFNREGFLKEFLKKEKKGKALLCELFLEKTFELYGKKIPCVCVVPMGLRLNQKIKSDRWVKMRDYYPKISSIISLPLDIFPKVLFHSEIIIFNIPDLDAHYFLSEENF